MARLKDNARYKIIKRNKANKKRGVTSDHIIEFTGFYSSKKCSINLRKIRYIDKETGNVYVYLTNDFKHSANTIADIYKQRWQIELFFKALKHNLKIKTFWGTSINAVYSQVWVALICYLLMSVLKYKFKFEASVGKLIQRIRSYIFETGDLMRFLEDKKLIPIEISQTNQITLCLKAGQ